MKFKYFILTLISCFICSKLTAQHIDNSLLFKHINTEGYFRLSYDNDFFSATDEYYTQGIDAELALPQMKKLYTNKLLTLPQYSFSIYGVGLQHNGFTPSSISSDDILYNDRPFAAILIAKTFAITIDTIRKQRFSSSLYLGVIGQAAGAKEMQEYIHDKLDNITPHGWQHQINNDIALNYQIQYEKQILNIEQILSVGIGCGGNVGTLNTNAFGNISILAGYFSNPYNRNHSTQKIFNIYGYLSSEGKYVVYNATLQGGLFEKRSPYTLSETDISRTVANLRYGLRISYRSIFLEYFRTTLSREFNTGHPHTYGGFQIATSIATN